MDLQALIPASYRASRQRFAANLEHVRSRWPAASHAARPLDGHPALTIDWIRADAVRQRERLFILTTAEHGIEGYLGSAVMQLFCAEFLLRLDPATAGVLLVHALNPWGMENRCRVNSSNVDLNRNFVSVPADFDPAFNPDYRALRRVLRPQGRVQTPWRAAAEFNLRLLRGFSSFGERRMQRGVLLGQYADPQGPYFGGRQPQEETRHLRDLVLHTAAGYPQVVWVDVHTGYGPRDEMTLVLSAAEGASAQELRSRLGYPRLAKADGGEFYAMRGDMVDYFYGLFARERPEAGFFALAFEFGTLGGSLPARMRALRAVVLENQLRQHGAVSQQAEHWVRGEFSDLFLPRQAGWYGRAEADARHAFAGILGYGEFIQRD
jgi:hypothetical protein